MKRIHFTQQKSFGYVPLRLGLRYITKEQADGLAKQMYPGRSGFEFCPKLYTTRTRPLSGEYYVVEGSRFKAKPVETRIEFRVDESCKLDLRNALVINATLSYEERSGNVSCHADWAKTPILDRNGLSFAELDLGIKGATFEQLRDELLRLNPKATIDTPFFVSMLTPIEESDQE